MYAHVGLLNVCGRTYDNIQKSGRGYASWGSEVEPLVSLHSCLGICGATTLCVILRVSHPAGDRDRATTILLRWYWAWFTFTVCDTTLAAFHCSFLDKSTVRKTLRALFQSKMTVERSMHAGCCM